MKLTSVQTKYLPGVLWLTDPGNRGEGRSSLLAYAFLMNAIQSLGKNIEIWDHIPHYQQKKYLIYRITDLFNEMNFNKKYTLTTNITDGTIRLDRLKGNDIGNSGGN